MKKIILTLLTLLSVACYSQTVIEPEMVLVQGGTFRMGSDEFGGSKPSHSVTLSSYYIGKYEVTQKEWRSVMGWNQSVFKGNSLPVENVSWNDCQVFIKKLNAKTGKKYRLPTEAEWEFAARGGNKSQGYRYAGSNNLDDIAWYEKNTFFQPEPVGLKQPNELGLYDMTGNVQEWCNDYFGDYSSSAQTNPQGVESGSERVIRGCSYIWSNRDGKMNTVFRTSLSPDIRQGIKIWSSEGLRLACSL